MKPIQRTSPADICLNLVLTAISPLQTLVDQPGVTHEFCNRQAMLILRNDGFTPYADFFLQHTKELNLGVSWADKGWKNVHHYFDPCSGKGLWTSAGAIESFKIYYQMASAAATQSDLNKAVFFLGAAAHLVQDLCVPHHARAKLFCGHQHYEHWVQQHFAKYAVGAQGAYNEGQTPDSLILHNAHTAADFLDWATNEAGEAKFGKVTEHLLALAQRSTAGLFRQFACEVLKIEEKPGFKNIVKVTVA
ncbi:MAG TPA: phospholipase [Firmicutes bacterium]|nr:phospholipase [Bacillota bacterium]